jgi:limonene-1,2-epoxide hydrolase
MGTAKIAITRNSPWRVWQENGQREFKGVQEDKALLKRRSKGTIFLSDNIRRVTGAL